MENWFTQFGTELLGSMILVILGNGVVANVLLKGTKAHNSHFVIIALGWGFALAVGALISSAIGGKAHLNPAVTLAFVVNDWTTNVGVWELLPVILGGQIIGFVVGQIIVDLVYAIQIKENFATNAQGVLGMHATVPQNRVHWVSFLMEFLGTALLVASILTFNKFGWPVGVAGPIVLMIVLAAIGCSLSGTTGFAVNPFRDLMPRLVYQVLILLPLGGQKASADWKYAWVPVLAPLCAGAVIGACFLI